MNHAKSLQCTTIAPRCRWGAEGGVQASPTEHGCRWGPEIRYIRVAWDGRAVAVRRVATRRMATRRRATRGA